MSEQIVPISIRKGIVDAEEIPEGVALIVTDFDVEGEDLEDLWVDPTSGDFFRKTKYTAEGQEVMTPPESQSAAAFMLTQ